MEILGWIGKLDSLSELYDIHDYVLKHQPCMAFLSITYMNGFTGHFLACAIGNKYNSVTIGKPMYDMCVAALYSDMQPILDS